MCWGSGTYWGADWNEGVALYAVLIGFEDLCDVGANPSVKVRIVKRLAFLWIGIKIDQMGIRQRQLLCAEPDQPLLDWYKKQGAYGRMERRIDDLHALRPTEP
jgi:hypothetical protein